MPFRGVVIEESLADRTVLGTVTVVRTTVQPVTEWHRTPWLTRWTLHFFEIADDRAEAVARQFGSALDSARRGSWYVDFKNDSTHYVVFHDRTFRVRRSEPAEYEPAKQHGRGLGIPEHQLDFDTVDLDAS